MFRYTEEKGSIESLAANLELAVKPLVFTRVASKEKAAEEAEL